MRRNDSSGNRDEVGDTEEMLECDTQKQQVKKRQTDISRSTEMTGQEASKAHPNNTNSNKTDINHIDNSQSVITDRQLFNKILAQCQLECFDKDIRRIFYDAVERLFYCRELKIGTSVLPGERCPKQVMRSSTIRFWRAHCIKCTRT